MMRDARQHALRGFTLIELVMTLALVGVVAMTAIPLHEVVTTRMKEAELRMALRTIRTALDAYKANVDDGTIPKQTGESGYPPSLATLVQGVEVRSKEVALNGRPAVRRIVFLRQVPRDPFCLDAHTPAEQTWDTRAYGSPPDRPASGDDVFDVASKSARLAFDGTRYSAW